MSPLLRYTVFHRLFKIHIRTHFTIFLANVVTVLGKKRAIDLMHETEMINAQGGMMTNVSTCVFSRVFILFLFTQEVLLRDRKRCTDRGVTVIEPNVRGEGVTVQPAPTVKRPPPPLYSFFEKLCLLIYMLWKIRVLTIRCCVIRTIPEEERLEEYSYNCSNSTVVFLVKN